MPKGNVKQSDAGLPLFHEWKQDLGPTSCAKQAVVRENVCFHLPRLYSIGAFVLENDLLGAMFPNSQVILWVHHLQKNKKRDAYLPGYKN